MSGRDGVRGRWHTCEGCGKRGYYDRKTAKAARAAIPGEHLAVYRCTRVDEARDTVWHLGHLDREIVAGHIERGRFYGPNGAGRARVRAWDRRAELAA